MSCTVFVFSKLEKPVYSNKTVAIYCAATASARVVDYMDLILKEEVVYSMVCEGWCCKVFALSVSSYLVVNT